MQLERNNKIFLAFILLLGTHYYFLSNLRFTAWPEMLSYPYLRNNGFLLYIDMIHPYPPVLTMALSVVYSLFGYSLSVVKTFTWILILTNDVLIFLLLRLLAKSEIKALIGVGLYVLLQPFLEGNMLWFDLAIVPFILSGIFFATRTSQGTLFKERSWMGYLLAGVAFGIGALIKQTAGIFLLLGALWLIYKKVNWQSVGYFALGPAVMGILLVDRLIMEDALQGFLNWTLIYPFTFWQSFPGYVDMALDNTDMLILSLLLLIPATVLVQKYNNLNNGDLGLLLIMFVGSMVSVYPRFSYFHLQLAVALIAVFAGYAASKKQVIFYLIFFAVMYFQVYRPVVLANWGGEARFYNSSDKNLAKAIKKNTDKDDTVYLQGVHSGYYVLADRLPPKPWTDNFGWYLEAPGVQEWVIMGWETDPPDVVVLSKPTDGNWYDLGTYRPKTITSWLEENYNREMELEEGVWLWEEK